MISKDEIKIITYNILADYLNDPEYVLVKKKYLDNDFRIKLLIKQFEKIFKKNKYNTIVCLQEVGPTQLSTLYIWFNNINYKCFNYGDLAIFFPQNLIPLYFETNQIKSLSHTYLKSNLLKEEINDKKFSQKYILAEFFLPNSKKKLTVCTTHLVANPKFENIKFLQGYLLAKRLEKYKITVLCGDFNSKPDSNLYKLLDEGELSIKDIFPKIKNLKVKNNFNSLYKLIHKKEKNITTHATNITTPIFTETIDYIWINDKIKPISTEPILLKKDTDNKSKDDFLPNKKYPSDHFMLNGNIEIS